MGQTVGGQNKLGAALAGMVLKFALDQVQSKYLYYFFSE